jgi:hypothetical protein
MRAQGAFWAMLHRGPSVEGRRVIHKFVDSHNAVAVQDVPWHNAAASDYALGGSKPRQSYWQGT